MVQLYYYWCGGGGGGLVQLYCGTVVLVGCTGGGVGVGTVVLLSKPCCPRGYGDVI